MISIIMATICIGLPIIILADGLVDCCRKQRELDRHDDLLQ